MSWMEKCPLCGNEVVTTRARPAEQDKGSLRRVLHFDCDHCGCPRVYEAAKAELGTRSPEQVESLREACLKVRGSGQTPVVYLHEEELRSHREHRDCRLFRVLRLDYF